MKIRAKKSAGSRDTPLPPPRVPRRQRAPQRTVRGDKVDSLDITRGQNAEKGNTLDPRNIRDEGVIGH